MERVYYKSRIYEVTEFENFSFNLGDMEHFGFNETSDEFLRNLKNLKHDIREEFINDITKIPENEIINLSKTKYEKIKKTIDRIFKNLCDEYNRDIIFEIVPTKNGDLYGKEILTGLLFPICNLNKIKYKVSKSYITNTVTDYNYNEIFFVKNFNKGYGYYNDQSEYIIENYYKKNISTTYYSKYGRFCTLICGYCCENYYPIRTVAYSLKPVVNSFENLILCGAILFEPKTARKSEVEKYLNRFNGFMKKKI